MKPIVEVRLLEKSFANRTVIQNISFTLYEGERLGIVGESGSGKSTIAKLLCRLEDVDAGKILLYGKDITNVKGTKRLPIYEQLQMVFQNPKESFHPRYKFKESLLDGMTKKGISKTQAKQSMYHFLNECGLADEYAMRYPHEVSLGECQRVAIARALMKTPSIMICDEATSSLDVTIQKQIIELLKKLHKKEKLSFLFISHDIALIQQFCDRVLVIQEGVIVEEGTPDAIIGNPKCEYTKNLIDSVYDW